MTSLAELTPLTEREFQQQICELAELRGWEWMHPRAGRTVDSWRTPMSGTMAQGWPDLVLVHPVKRRLLFVEVKRPDGKLTPHQDRVLSVLENLEGLWHAGPEELRVEVHVWRPVNWPIIERELAA